MLESNAPDFLPRIRRDVSLLRQVEEDVRRDEEKEAERDLSRLTTAESTVPVPTG